MKTLHHTIKLASLALVALLSWSCAQEEEQYADLVELTRVKEISYDSAVGVGYVKGVCSEMGFWYAKAENPDAGKMLPAQGGVQFEATLPNLEKGTEYLVRTYAICNGQTLYSPQKSFTTLREGEPLIRVATPTGLLNTTATLEGYVITSGGSQITERGFCYGTSQTPTRENSASIAVKGGFGRLAADLTELEDGVTYYCRVYLENAMGLFYSEVESFTTIAFNKPVPTMVTIAGMGTATLVATGKVESDNELPITACGVRYSLTEEFKDGIDVAAATSGKGEFQVTLSNLDPTKLYNTWAYAANRKGKVYSDMMTVQPTITLEKVSALSRSMIGEVKIANLGAFGVPVTETGICWSTTPNPTIESDTVRVRPAVEGGTFDVGEFTTPSGYGLTASTTYYVRAYAINQYGCAYSAEQEFTTRADLYDSQIRTGSAGGKLPYFQGWQIILEDVTNAAASNVPESALSPAFRAIYAGLERACTSFNGAFMNGVIYRVRPTTNKKVILQFVLYYRPAASKTLTSTGWSNIEFERDEDGICRFLSYKPMTSGIYTTNTAEGKAAIDKMYTYFKEHDFYFEWSTPTYTFSTTLDNTTGPIRLVPVDVPDDYWTFTAKTYTASGDISEIANPF